MKDYFSYIFNKVRVKLLLLDQIILLLAIILSYFARTLYDSSVFSCVLLRKILLVYLILSPLVILSFYIFGVYERWEIGNFSKNIVKIFFSLVFVSIFIGFIFYFIPYYFIGRLVFILIFPFYFLLLILQRFFFYSKFERKINKQRVFFLGFSKKLQKIIINEFENNPLFMFEFVTDDKIKSFVEQIESNFRKDDIIVISLENKEIKYKMEEIIELKFKGFFIYDFDNFYMSLSGKIFDISFENVWHIVYEKNYLINISSYYKLKRLFDIIISLLILAFSSPVFLIIPLLIKLTSRGPVFFIQERLGWYKKPFKLIKFRTMIIDAEKETGPKWSGKNDPRITKIGKFLRFSRLDELPQLINVLKGDMSLIGNRPIRKYFADMLKEKIPFYDLRFFIKPGLTGWSQVKMGYINTVEQQMEKFKYELYYIKNMSFIFDLIILIKTIKTVLNFNGR